MKITGMRMRRAQRGWHADPTVQFYGSEQFTAVEQEFSFGGRWWWSALWNAWRGGKRIGKLLESGCVDERKAKGWG